MMPSGIRSLFSVARGHDVLGRFGAGWHRVRHPKVRWGTGIRVRGRLHIVGPGQVIIGDDVLFDRIGGANYLVTLSPHAVIEIGRGSYINGASLCASEAISVGADCIVGMTYVIDSDFHMVGMERRRSTARPPSAAVRIGVNVWLANRTIVTRGVTIGDNSVVGIGTVVTGPVPSDAVVAGPAFRIIRRLDRDEDAVHDGLDHGGS